MQAPPNSSFEPNRFIGTGDARRVAERLASCSHFSGEFDGDRSDRDKEVAAAMVALSCETIDQDVSAVRKKYAGDRAVQEALMAASQL